MKRKMGQAPLSRKYVKEFSFFFFFFFFVFLFSFFGFSVLWG